MIERKLYLDSAKIDEIDLVIDSLAIAGVTTNPSLVAKTDKRPYSDLISEIAKRMTESEVKKHLSVEVLSLVPEEMYNEAFQIIDVVRKHDPKSNFIDLFIKIPMTIDYVSIMTKLARKGVSVNATACMHFAQALTAYDAGARVVSFFFNRMKDTGLTLSYEISEFMRISSLENTKCKRPNIICGSIRRPEDIITCWDAGADIVTAPLSVIKSFMSHPKTDEAIEGFRKDIEGWLR